MKSILFLSTVLLLAGCGGGGGSGDGGGGNDPPPSKADIRLLSITTDPNDPPKANDCNLPFSILMTFQNFGGTTGSAQLRGWSSFWYCGKGKAYGQAFEITRGIAPTYLEPGKQVVIRWDMIVSLPRSGMPVDPGTFLQFKIWIQMTIDGISTYPTGLSTEGATVYTWYAPTLVANG